MIARSLALSLTLLALPAAAFADGLPLPVDDAGGTGVAVADGSVRYLTARAGHGTVVEKLDARKAAILRTKYLHGAFTIPVVALDGTPDGLSHDGSTLVLIKPRASFPRKRTPLTIVDTTRMRARPLTLKGDFSFDAVSPDGRTAYLINYVNGRDPTKYHVRALDLRSGRLLGKPIVDPTERDEDMRGYPARRATSADGRWHYTLYDANGGKPFIHALDSVGLTARCIDLPLDPRHTDVYSLHLRVDGGTLHVAGGKGRTLVDVNTASFAVTKPAAPGTRSESDSGGGSMAPGWVALAALLLLSAGAALTITRRRQLARR